MQQQDKELNSAWFVFGTKNELKDYIRDLDGLNEYFVDVESPYEITIYLEN